MVSSMCLTHSTLKVKQQYLKNQTVSQENIKVASLMMGKTANAWVCAPVDVHL